MKTLDVYSRKGCHLCDELVEALLPLVHGRLALVVHDVDSRADWQAAYATRVPVVEYDGEFVCQYHLDADALARILGNLPA